MKYPFLLLTAALFAVCRMLAQADDTALKLRADREAIERIYHAHRLGTVESFENAMPAAELDQLVQTELKKEAVLRRVYQIEITPAMIAAEVERINSSTRAPEVLEEIKRALGNDPGRFATAMARPILVERELRQRFDNDASLHSSQRAEAEKVRADLLAKKSAVPVQSVTWQLSSRPVDNLATAAAAPTIPVPANGKSKAYTNQATVQRAKTLTTPAGTESNPAKQYLEDLDPVLQNLLTSQLRNPGDVSPVLDLPGGFTVFQLGEKTSETVTAVTSSVPRRSYAEWIAQQP